MSILNYLWRDFLDKEQRKINVRFNENLIIGKYHDSITDISDLTAGDKPSLIFPLLILCLGYLLDNDIDKTISSKGITARRKLNPVIKKLGPMFLASPQIIENRNSLVHPGCNIPDTEIILPDTPVIWTPNHSFKDDALATILAIKRHAYLLFGSLPQFYNTIDGITAWLNGVVMINRKSKISKQVAMEKMEKVLHYGTDIVMYPEGVWNKTPNQLILDLWPGVWRLAKENGAPVVPVVHYKEDCSNSAIINPIHTVVDDPIRIDDLSEKAGLEYLREVMAYWTYLLMEKYGKSTREKELGEYVCAKDVWEACLMERKKSVSMYDEAIEFWADYRPKLKVTASDVWRKLARVDNVRPNNALFVGYANMIMKQERVNDFQHRY